MLLLSVDTVGRAMRPPVGVVRGVLVIVRGGDVANGEPVAAAARR